MKKQLWAVKASAWALLATTAMAAVPTPERPVTDSRSLVSAINPSATAAPLEDLVYSRSLGSSAWSADGKQVYLVTNFTGRQNIWRVDIGGSWPVQMTQSDDSQGGLTVSADGKTLFFTQDTGGNEMEDIYAVPADGGRARNVSNTPEIAERGLVSGPTEGQLAFGAKRKGEGQVNLAVMDTASGTTRLLTDEKDAQRRWSPVAWVDGGRAIIANRSNANSTEEEIWRVDVGTGKATRLAAANGQGV